MQRKPVVNVAPRLLSEAQAAAYLGMSIDTLKRLAIAGKIPVCKVIGRGQRARRMYDRAALDRWIETNNKILAC